MVFHLFFLTITISKRQFSKTDITRACIEQRNEELLEKNKQRGITLQRFI